MWIYLIGCLFLCVEIYASSRIVNGTDAVEGEFPFAISLRRNSSHICGGSILNPTHVLTAAHCVCNTETRMFCIDTNKFSLTCKITKPLSSSLFSIQHGLLKITEKPVNTIDVKNVYCHKFDTSSLTYDAAVLELDSPIPPGQGLPVMLSPHYIADKEHIGTIIGWGKLSHDGGISEVLQKMKVEIYDEKTCGKKFNNDHHICFGSPFGGACNGDSGSALLIGGKQVGIASFITDKCGIANEEHPNVYSKVATYFDWIMETAKMKPSLHHE